MHDNLTPRERERFDIVQRCSEGKIANAVAAAQLGLKVRQLQRIKQKVAQDGEKGVIHGNRGRASNRATDVQTQKEVVTFLQDKKHRDFGPTFAKEQLEKQKHIVLSDETVRAIMIANQLWKPKARRGAGVRHEWRERKPLHGELVQFDGSYHDWFEDGTEACLLAAIDDATSQVLLAFEANEGVHAVFRFWWAYIERWGCPGAVYLDKFSTYKVNHKNAVDNAALMMQFERAMGELGVAVICANSPEAKAAHVETLLAKWQKKLKLAQTKIRKLRTRQKYFERKIAASGKAAQ